MRLFNKFFQSETGSIAVPIVISMTALVGVSGLAIDFGMSSSLKAQLQTAADSAAVAGANEIALAGADMTHITAVAKSFADINMANASVSTSVSMPDNSSVSVEVTKTFYPPFASLYSSGSIKLSATATATRIGGAKICVLALDNASERTISMSKKSKLTAVDCGAYSNSIHSNGIEATDTAVLATTLTCSAGGYSGSTLNFAPQPVSDCPPVPDPLVGRLAPPVGSCDHTDLVIEAQTVTLDPGVYCGGLAIKKHSVVTLRPGIYVIKDGKLLVDTNGRLQGENVGVYLTGDESVIKFWSNGAVNLTAPKNGPMASLLFFEDRNSPPDRVHQIKSDEARVLLGVLYFPRGILRVDASQKVADQSAYTSIIANKLELDIQPVLVLNSDYGATDIPVPGALSGISGKIVLSR